jgi:hypothetical protein
MVSVQHCHGIGRGRSSSEWTTSHPSYYPPPKGST